jgi:Fic family protein
MQELMNYKNVFEFVSKYLEDGGPITEVLVREIHKRLVEGVRGGVLLPARSEDPELCGQFDSRQDDLYAAPGT